MKPFPSITVLAFISLCGLVRANFLADFGESPYVQNESVLGIDGWENRLPTETDTRERALVESAPWGEGKPVLVLRGASIKKGFPELVGGRVSITFTLAVQGVGPVLPGRQFRIFFEGAPIGEIYYEPGPDGGFGYAGGGDGRSGGILCVPQSEILENAFYTFTLEIDPDQQTFQIAVTGKKADGSCLDFIAENITFLSSGNTQPKVKAVHILTGKSIEVFLGSLTIELK